MSAAARLVVPILLALFLAGCGGTGTSGAGPGGPDGPAAGPRVAAPPPAPPPPPDVVTTRQAGPGAEETASLPLQAGWNMVSFPVGEVTSLTPGEGVHASAFAFRDGTYDVVDLTVEGVNAGEGTARGLWVYASQASSLSYDGTWDGATPDLLTLQPGWNLVGFPCPFASSPDTLQAALDGHAAGTLRERACEEVPPTDPGCGLHRWAFEYSGNGYGPRDLASPATRLEGGRGAWVYCHAGGTLQYPLEPATEPSPSPSPSPVPPADFLLSASDGFSTWRLDPASAGLRYQGRTAPFDPSVLGRFVPTKRQDLLYFVDGSLRPVLVDPQDGGLTFASAQAGLSTARAACADRTGDWLLIADDTTLRVARVHSDGSLSLASTTATLPAPGVAVEVVRVGDQDVVVVGLQGGFVANQRNVLAFPFDPADPPALGPAGSGVVLGSDTLSVRWLASAFVENETRVYGVAGRRVQAWRVDASGNLSSRNGADLFTLNSNLCLERVDLEATTPLLLVGSTRTDQANLKLLRADSLATLASWQLPGGLQAVSRGPDGTRAAVGTAGQFPNRYLVDLVAAGYPIVSSAVDRGTSPADLHLLRTFPATPAPPLPPTTERVNLGTGGAQADAHTYTGDTNGRFLVFASAATNLVPGDTNGFEDVFLRDLGTGEVTLISRAAGGGPANGASTGPRLSADGRYVAFGSSASNLVAGDDNGFRDIFLHDRQQGTTLLVSVDASGAQADGHSDTPALSRDGAVVGFHSAASNLVAGDTNSQTDVFVRVPGAGTTERVSLSSAGNQGTAGSYGASLSQDGRHVAFWSYAPEMAPGQASGAGDVFVHDRVSRVTSLASVQGTTALGGLSRNPQISGDARYVLFESNSSSSTSSRVYLRDRTASQTHVVNLDVDGDPAPGHCYAGGLSDDGRYVAFSSDSDDLVREDHNGARDVFLLDRTLGDLVRVSVGGQWQEGGGASFGGLLLPDASRVLFASEAANLVPGDTNSRRDLFLGENLLPLLGE